MSLFLATRLFVPFGIVSVLALVHQDTGSSVTEIKFSDHVHMPQIRIMTRQNITY